MKHSEGKLGRVFLLRLEDGDRLPECVEKFCSAQGVKHGQAVVVGGIAGGKIVVGPERIEERPPKPVLLPVEEAHEVLGVGVIAPDESGTSVLHIHASLGRGDTAKTGCLRPGVDTWLVGEVIIYELTGLKATRRRNPDAGFALLEIED
jgi:predicted DNA-binding protein with PD1-like motif